MDEEYIKSILNQTLESYKILYELRDTPGDLDTIRKENGKIHGLVQVLVNKLNSDSRPDFFDDLFYVLKKYLRDYSFSNEIETISKLYAEDPNRIKNIRLTILTALEESQLITKMNELLHES